MVGERFHDLERKEGHYFGCKRVLRDWFRTTATYRLDPSYIRVKRSSIFYFSIQKLWTFIPHVRPHCREPLQWFTYTFFLDVVLVSNCPQWIHLNGTVLGNSPTVYETGDPDPTGKMWTYTRTLNLLSTSKRPNSDSGSRYAVYSSEGKWLQVLLGPKPTPLNVVGYYHPKWSG